MSNIPNTVVVHPLVLLSVVDHYNRVARDTKKRVVGVLLGTEFKGKIDVTNSYAVPFEEDLKDSSIWYLDHMYHERLYAMFKKVNAKEKVVGWYSTGPKIKPADIEINELLRRYTNNPSLVIIDVNPKDDLEIPTEAYVSIEQNLKNGSDNGNRRQFVRVPSEVGAYEAEEVGVEHLLRDVTDATVGTLSDQVKGKVNSLKGLIKRMELMQKYLQDVASGSMPINHQILYSLQDVFSLSPNLKVEELVRAFSIKTNDNMMVVYLSSLIRSIIALHNLINNKEMNREVEKKEVEGKQASEKKNAEKQEAETKDDNVEDPAAAAKE